MHTEHRSIAPDDYFLGRFETALEEGELIIQVEFPIPKQTGYERFAITGAASCVCRVGEMEEALVKQASPDALSGITVSRMS